MKSFLRRFLADRSGNILMIAGLGFLFLVGIGGAAHDLGKQQLVKQRIQQAADAGALAAASMDFGTVNADRESMARNIYALNYPDTYLGVARPPVNVTINAPANVTVSAATTVPTSFVGNFGIDTLAANGRSVVQIKRPDTPLDVMLVTDVSDSMRANDVGGPYLYPSPLLFPPNSTICNLFCQPSRMNAARYLLNQVATSLLNPNTLRHRIAMVNWASTVRSSYPFDSVYTSVQERILGIFQMGGTDSSLGLLRAEEIILADFRNNATRVVILMTDGGNNGPAAPKNESSIATCNRLKARPNTLVFTIAFGPDVANSVPIAQFLSDCATGPNGPNQPNAGLFFFPAPDAAALNRAFTSIIATAKKVQIVQ